VTHRPPPPPRFASRREYGDRLGDPAYWMPYLRTVLARHRLPDADASAGVIGTYPTFLVGAVVVKVFGHFPSWRDDHDVEQAVLRLLDDDRDIPAARLLAHGRLFDDPEPWPYLVVERVPGRDWHRAPPAPSQRHHVAEQLGTAVRHLHDLPAPTDGPVARDWLAGGGAPGSRCAERHRAWGSLPARLADQIEAYLVPPSYPRRLVHADLTPEHVFVDGGRLSGVIDWGDAMTTDPHYELGALHLGVFDGDRALLRAFLAGYGWTVDDGFARRALSAALRHQFDLFASQRLRLNRFATLDEVAAALFGVDDR
jgi:hygromycin-B 7''-O-kinase